jgi:hypothetical protein
MYVLYVCSNRRDKNMFLLVGRGSRFTMMGV